jgi:uncharacterized protein (DUF2141 family)
MFRKSILALAVILAIYNMKALIAQTPAATSSDNATKTTLTVSLTGIRNDQGQVFIQLWNAPEGFPKQSEKALKYVAIDAAKAVNGTVTATFSDLALGTYAVSTLHDENRNGKMDTNAFGIPKEGWAVSNNVVTHMHAPSFEQASFQLQQSGQKISIALHY